MKKVITGFLFVTLLAVGVAGAEAKKTDFSLNLGLQTNICFGEWATAFDVFQGTLDLRKAFRLGRSFQISPEIMYSTGYNFHFEYSFLYPGVMVNYKVTDFFFIGAGPVVPIVLGAEDNKFIPSPKINFGLCKGRIMMTLYVIIWTGYEIPFLDLNFIGLTFGYRF